MTYHLHIKGRVQGVGFRPLVYKLARQHHLVGQVANTTNGLHVHFNLTNGTTAADFIQALMHDAPLKAKVQSWVLEEELEMPFDDFTIGINDSSEVSELLVSPDFALCDECRKEFNDPGNRRYQYPFITCTNCGPRFSIMETIPYERHLTTMNAFEQCPDCRAEYHDPDNRRFFSQTNSCPACGIRLSWHDALSKEVETDPGDIQRNLMHAFNEGMTVAVKGVGGFLLMCDASNRLAIQTLRERKHRPDKPFAVLFPNIEAVNQFTDANQKEIDWLTNEVSPIVIMHANEECFRQLDMDSIAPGLSTIGVMIPHAPLLEWIMNAWNKPLIATSGNLSGSAIVFQSDRKEELFRFADFILDHDRDIVLPQDDSVIRVSKQTGKTVILRRARGLAPSILLPYSINTDKVIFAVGAKMKSAFAFAHQHQLYISPYLGNLESLESYQHYTHSYQQFCRLLHAIPEVVLTDLHPDFPSTIFAKELAAEMHLPVKQIQHHEAHFAAVLGENGLLNKDEKVLGVIWDGTGIGNDGQLWGGEFFLYENGGITRTHFLEPFTHVAGDKLAKEPRLAALSILNDMEEASEVLNAKFSFHEIGVYRKLISNNPTLNTSAGRYFDAVASMLGIQDVNSFEGQAAMLLEQQAASYINEGGNKPGHYLHQEINGQHVPMKDVLCQILIDHLNKTSAKVIAARFHDTLVEIIRQVALQLPVDNIAFSGGVFQNAVLLNAIEQELSGKYRLYFHQQLSPNDECIAFGQIMHYQNIKS